MKEEDKKNISALILTFAEQKQYVPFFEDFVAHPAYGPIFSALDDKDKQEVTTLIDNHINEKIYSYRTKGWQYFQRFFENNPTDFWAFRKLNRSDDLVKTPEFQSLGKKIEQEMFRYEWLLTESMLHRPEALDKVVGAFYNIVYYFFPRFWKIETE